MKHLIIAGIIALTALSSCEMFDGTNPEIPLTHNDSIYQMLVDTIAVLHEDHHEVFYKNPDDSWVLDIGDYPVEWCPGDDPPFWTELDLIVTRDSIINNYSFMPRNELRRSAFPLEHIGSIKTEWHNRAIGGEAPEGTIIPRKYGDYTVMQPTIRVMVIHLNTMYRKSNGQIYIAKSATVQPEKLPGGLYNF